MTVRITEEDPRFHEPFVSPEPVSSPYPVVRYQEEGIVEQQELTEAQQREEYHLSIEDADIGSIISDADTPTSMLLFQEKNPYVITAAIEDHAQWLHGNIKSTLLQLGYYLFWAEKLRLWQYAKQPDMRSWMESIFLNSDIRAHAQDIYKTYREMRDVGYPITRLTEGDITVSKMREIRHELRDYKRQQKTLTEKPVAVEHGEDEEEGSAYQEEEEEDQFLPRVQADPPPQGEESLVDIKAKIETIAALRENEVIGDQKARAGIPERTPLFFRDIRVSSTGLATATVTFRCSEEELKAISRGYITCLLSFPGVDGTLSLQKPDELDMIVDQFGGVIDAEAGHHQYEHEGYDL